MYVCILVKHVMPNWIRRIHVHRPPFELWTGAGVGCRAVTCFEAKTDTRIPQLFVLPACWVLWLAGRNRSARIQFPSCAIMKQLARICLQLHVFVCVCFSFLVLSVCFIVLCFLLIRLLHLLLFLLLLLVIILCSDLLVLVCWCLHAFRCSCFTVLPVVSTCLHLLALTYISSIS